MTEQEWLTCEDPHALSSELLGMRVTDRQFWLYYCGCFRRIWDLLTDERSRLAVEALELFAEGQKTKADLEQVRQAAAEATEQWEDVLNNQSPATAFAALAVCRAFDLFDGAFYSYYTPGFADELAARAANREGAGPEGLHQAQFRRHIYGNPFKPYPAPSTWPSTVVQLANALYDGQDCGFALHDALLDAGHPDLADHFRQDQTHPKGCWALDLLLGKE